MNRRYTFFFFTKRHFMAWFTIIYIGSGMKKEFMWWRENCDEKKNLRILPFKICMLSECVEIGRFRWKTDLFIGYFFLSSSEIVWPTDTLMKEKEKFCFDIICSSLRIYRKMYFFSYGNEYVLNDVRYINGNIYIVRYLFGEILWVLHRKWWSYLKVQENV